MLKGVSGWKGSSPGNKRGCTVAANVQSLPGTAGLAVTMSKLNSISRGKDVGRNLNQIKLKAINA